MVRGANIVEIKVNWGGGVQKLKQAVTLGIFLEYHNR
jgi:hypothetical protein